MLGVVPNKKYKDAEATQLFPDDPDAVNRARKDMPVVIILIVISFLIYLAFAALIDPYKVFNIIDFNTRNFELSGRYNKIEYLKKNPKQGFIFGTSRANGIPTDVAAKLTGLDFYHMTSPGDSYKGTYLKVKWVLENQPVKHIVLALDFVNAMGPTTTSNRVSLVHKEHPDISGENPIAFFWSFFWAHPRVFAYTVHGNLIRKGTWWWWDRETGHYHFVEKERDLIENQARLFKERAKTLASLVRAHPTIIPTFVNLKKIDWINKAVALAKSKGVKTTVILNPTYPGALAWIGEENYNNWRRAMANQIKDVWDFAVFTGATCNDVNWFDLSHFAFSLGDILLNLSLNPKGEVARDNRSNLTAVNESKNGVFGPPDRCDG